MTECEYNLTLSTWKCYVLSVHIPAARRTSINACTHIQHIHDVCMHVHRHRQTDRQTDRVKSTAKFTNSSFFLCGNYLVVSTCVVLYCVLQR